MKEYIVYYSIIGTASVIVEADSEETAKEQALNNNVVHKSETIHEWEFYKIKGVEENI